MSDAKLPYRPEIDGLRAVAVLPVILFHGGFEWFRGGFVGVDIFFVISGYLITTILLDELERGRFSLVGFYERRARRILPALFLVLAACLPFAWQWMAPTELASFGKSVIAAVLFTSNILFWRESGYFEAPTDTKPLIHTWSLAVEEQYYLLFPIFLFLAWRLGRRPLFALVLAFAIASFLLCQWAANHAADANFYLAPTRAWELLAGSICAFVAAQRTVRANEVGAATGLALVAGSIILLDEQLPFPSAYAVPPVVGTVLLLWFAKSGTWTARILAARKLVGIGLISYSAYLWHQPLFAFARIRSLTTPSPMLMAGLAFASLLLAYFSWRFVEQPFRKRPERGRPDRRAIFAKSAMGGALLVAAGASAYATSGFPTRFDPGLATLDARLAANKGLHRDCNVQHLSVSPRCRTSDRPRVLVWGDSNAMTLIAGLRASDPGIALQQLTKPACAPVPGVAAIRPPRYTREWAEGCNAFNAAVIDWIKDNPSIETVIIASPFEGIGNGPLLDRDGTVHGADGEKIALARFAAATQAIRAGGAKLIVVTTVPRSGWDVGQCLRKRALLGLAPNACDFPARPHDARRFLGALSAIVPVHDLSSEICQRGICRPLRGEIMLYRDPAHLSTEGSAFLGKRYDWAHRLAADAR